MPPPARRVFTSPEAANGGCIKYLFDAAPEAPASLGQSFPNRLQHLQHCFGVNLADRDGANLRAVRGEGHRPLRNVLIVAPALAVSLYVDVGALAEARDRTFGLDASFTCF